LHHPITRYGLALGVVAVAAALRAVLGMQFPGLVPFVAFFPAVLVVTLLAGLGPGIAATGLSAFATWLLWLRPTTDLALSDAAASLNLVLFVLACLALVATAEAMRRYHERSVADERRFRAAEDLASDGAAILEAVRDPSGAICDFRWTYANPALATLLRRAGEGLIGRRLLEVLPGHRDHPALFPSYVEVVQTGEPRQAEIFYDADGLRGWFHLNVAKLEDGIALSLRDVTRRKERESELRESEERFRLLADAIDDVFWTIDLRQQKVVYVSPAYERVLGLSREDLQRDPRTWRLNLHPEDRAQAELVFEEALQGRRANFELVYRMRGADGGWRWVRDKSWRVRTSGIDWLVGVLTDITAEKAAVEQQRLVANELDHRLRNAFSLMLSIVRLSAGSAQGVTELASSLESRIHALARSQDAVMQGAWRARRLEAVIREALAPHTDRDDRIRVEGPAIEVGARQVPLLHMGSHELATNAAKYGALSVPGGRVTVAWKTVSEAQGEAVELTWRESGGPAVAAPARRGFGSTVIEQALAREFGGTIEIAYPPDGVVCAMRLPLSNRLTRVGNAA
jgi:PAS domain S-box-containing protein